ncbi:ABC transporter ATP-binding protein [Jeotgalibacillus sp. S-D1]|uniref:ABC transporter ATP-binding protein n=1 Tax=Jeotgalibacillus sp. S-D1 TaxID=2552189 RepID=UPI00105A5EF5|nr:ABC transporter ATP-binding protein [Jeotgalibacillus sp. S-D1]TDL32810.1 ABC transporter ATP-binding protein [Jeotgalibacillus sp. S-D1]
MKIINVQQVSKHLNGQCILNNLSFSVEKGEVVGLLGPNGSGKTTLVRLLLSMMALEEGQVHIFGKSIEEHALQIKEQMGVVPDTDELVGDLTGLEFLHFVASIRRIPKKKANEGIKGWLELFGLEFAQHQLIESYSHGMKKKLQFISVLLHEPKLIIFDEPTNGLDPDMILLMKEILRQLSKKGVSILLTTHHLHFADSLCNRVLFIKNGQLLNASHSPELLKKEFGADSLEEVYLKLTDLGKERTRLHELMADWKNDNEDVEESLLERS